MDATAPRPLCDSMSERMRIACLVHMAFAMGRGTLPGIAEVARTADWDLEVLPWAGDGLPDLRRLGVAGAILQPPADPGWPEWLRRTRLPAVVLGSPAHDLPSVTVDEAAMGAEAAQRLAARGFRRAGYLGRTWMPWGAAQLAGAARVMPIDTAPTAVVHAGGWTQRRDAIAAWLRGLDRPCAIIANGSLLAHGALTAAQALGWRVPEMCSVLALDDEEGLAGICTPSLATLTASRHEVGVRAGGLLRRLLAGAKPPTAPLLVRPEALIPGRSLDVAAADDPLVRAALLRLETPDGLALGVGRLAARLSVSPRTLERRMQAALGRTVRAVIRDRRLETARRLLADADASVATVARRAGFSGSAGLTRAFRAAFGTSPGRWRS